MQGILGKFSPGIYPASIADEVAVAGWVVEVVELVDVVVVGLSVDVVEVDEVVEVVVLVDVVEAADVNELEVVVEVVEVDVVAFASAMHNT